MEIVQCTSWMLRKRSAKTNQNSRGCLPQSDHQSLRDKMFHPSREDGLTRFANLHRNKEIPNIRTEVKSFPETSQCSILTSADDHGLVTNGYEYVYKNLAAIWSPQTTVKHCSVMSIAITPHVLVSQGYPPDMPIKQSWVFWSMGVSMSVSCGIPTLRLQNSWITTGKPQHATATFSICLYQVMLIVHTLQNGSWHFMIALDIASTNTGIPKFPCHILTSHQAATTKRERQNSRKAKPWIPRKKIWESSKQKASWGKNHRQLWLSLIHPFFRLCKNNNHQLSADEYCLGGATYVGFQNWSWPIHSVWCANRIIEISRTNYDLTPSDSFMYHYYHYYQC